MIFTESGDILGVGLAKYLTPKDGGCQVFTNLFEDSSDIVGVGLVKCTPRVGYQVCTNLMLGEYWE